MEHGFMLAAVGWQADVPRHAEADDERDLLTLEAPVAEGVTGLVGCEIVVDASTDLHSLGSRHGSLRLASNDDFHRRLRWP